MAGASQWLKIVLMVLHSCVFQHWHPLLHLPQVLRFHAYFQEAVHERAEEQFRVRRCTIYFYLEDDTIQVNESQQVNSGIPQGKGGGGGVREGEGGCTL